MTILTDKSPLKIGTRGSPLALAQAREVQARLQAAWNAPAEAFVIIVIKTSGDMIQDRPLKEVGGKGLFTKEIEEQLLAGDIDIAVHSMKDMPVAQPDGLLLDIFLPREDNRDAFVSQKYASIEELPAGAVVGTSSLRRRAQLLNLRPDLNVVEFRGNVQTRLKKLADGVADATFLAMAGLNRLQMDAVPATAIDVADILPAVAQGAIGIECRAGDDDILTYLTALQDQNTYTQLQAERAFLAALDGSCETPIAAASVIDGDMITLTGEVLRPDGSDKINGQKTGNIHQAVQIGRELALELLGRAPQGFMDWR